MWGKRDDARGERCCARKEKDAELTWFLSKKLKNRKTDRTVGLNCCIVFSEQAFFLGKLLQSYLFLKFLTIFSVKGSLK